MAATRSDVLARLEYFPTGLTFDALRGGVGGGSKDQLESLLVNLKRNKEIHCRNGLWFFGPASEAIAGAAADDDARTVGPRAKRATRWVEVDSVHIEDVDEKLAFLSRLADGLEQAALDVRVVIADLTRIKRACAGAK